MTNGRLTPATWGPEEDRILAQAMINSKTVKAGLETAANQLKRKTSQCSTRYYNIKDKIQAVSSQVALVKNNPHIIDQNLRVDMVVSLFNKLNAAQKLLVIEEVF